jgi:hypothetical protein
MNASRLQAYADLLEARHNAAHRNRALSGTIFILALAAFITLGMLGELGALETYLTATVVIVFALTFISSHIKLETIKGLRELCSYLL